MRKIKVKLDFVRLPTPNLIAFAGNIVSSMNKSPYFPTPDVPLEDLTEAEKYLDAKYMSSRSGGKTEISLMRDARETLTDLLYKQAAYVDRIAFGNLTVLLSSGFGTTKQPSSKHLPVFSVIDEEQHGQVTLKLKAVPGAKAYLWQYVADPMPKDESQWKLAGASTKATFLIKKLKSGTYYWFRAIAITSKGMMPHSEPIRKLVS
jgi:hypothetical protein